MLSALGLSGLARAEGFPLVGGFGFDLRQPTTATCGRMGLADVAHFTECEYLPTGNAFGLAFPFHSCQGADGADYLIYATSAQCDEALNTMKANAP